MNTFVKICLIISVLRCLLLEKREGIEKEGKEIPDFEGGCKRVSLNFQI